MKTYIVYVDGVEQKEYIKAANRNAAERKATKKYGRDIDAKHLPTPTVNVVYTEI